MFQHTVSYRPIYIYDFHYTIKRKGYIYSLNLSYFNYYLWQAALRYIILKNRLHQTDSDSSYTLEKDYKVDKGSCVP